MEITYQTDAQATSRMTSLPVASAAVRLTTPHVVSASQGELCPRTGTGVARPRAMELGAGSGAAARWTTGAVAPAAVQHLESVLALTTDDAAAKRGVDINGTNGFAKHHPGSATPRPPV